LRFLCAGLAPEQRARCLATPHAMGTYVSAKRNKGVEGSSRSAWCPRPHHGRDQVRH
jgi:hypothetical protein